MQIFHNYFKSNFQYSHLQVMLPQWAACHAQLNMSSQTTNTFWEHEISFPSLFHLKIPMLCDDLPKPSPLNWQPISIPNPCPFCHHNTDYRITAYLSDFPIRQQHFKGRKEVMIIFRDLSLLVDVCVCLVSGLFLRGGGGDSLVLFWTGSGLK